MAFTNAGLVKYAEYQLAVKSPYWYGTYGNIASEPLYKEKKKQYKDQYNKWPESSFTCQFGQKVHDCAGLIKGYLMTPDVDKHPEYPAVYNSKYDYSANGLEALAKEKGPISSIPEIAGLIVWKSGHVGIYVGNGEVIEERGHAYGTVKTKLKDRPWTKWFKCSFIEYSSPAPSPTPDAEVCDITLPVLQKGMKGDEIIRTYQYLLNAKGYRDENNEKLDPDASFGGKTTYATKKMQAHYGLPQTGIVDQATWNAFLKKP